MMKSKTLINWVRFWDDWIRHSEQRKNRSCIHPEISRSKTYGRHGVSKYDLILIIFAFSLLKITVLLFYYSGQFFDQHLKTIKLNKRFVPFKIKDLSYLLKVILKNINQMSTTLA